MEGNWVMRVDPSQMGLVPYTRDSRDLFFPLSTLQEYSKKAAICDPGSEPLPDIESARALILDFLAFRTVGEKHLLFNLPSLFFL